MKTIAVVLVGFVLVIPSLADTKTLQLDRNLAGHLRQFLDRIQYNDAVSSLWGSGVGHTTLFEDHVEKTPEIWRKILAERKTLPPTQKMALRLFFLGDTLAADEWKALFRASPLLNRALLRSGLARKQATETSLGGLSIFSQWLSMAIPSRALYLLGELPTHLTHQPQEPEVYVNATGLNLLRELERRQNVLWTKGRGIKGTAVDFGSGTGLQGIALLMMNVGMQRMIGLEISPLAMQVSRFNGHLNGVADRLRIESNVQTKQRPDPLSHALKKESISFAVSNPPFNIVPPSLRSHVNEYGDGGVDGLEITRLFLKQGLPRLKPGAEFVLYGQWARKPPGRDPKTNNEIQGELHLRQALKSMNLPARTFRVELLRPVQGSATVKEYSDDLKYAQALHQQFNDGSKTFPSVQQIADELKSAGVYSVTPYLISIRVLPIVRGLASGRKQ